MKSDSQSLEFDRHQPKGRKTPIVAVRSKSDRTLLGTIAWFGRWRQFCFWPEPHTTFNVGCMQDIEAIIGVLREERA